MTWTDLKSLRSVKNALFQFEDQVEQYMVWFEDESFQYYCYIEKEDPKSADQIDFEDNYCEECNKAVRPTAPDGKQIMLTSSRPDGTHTVFTGASDDIPGNTIGEGNHFVWDFSNATGDITAPSGFKRKRVVAQFIDNVWIKEGAVYFFNKVKGSYIDMYLMCPTGEVYLDATGSPVVATEDTVVIHQVIKHHVQGSAPMGDELNTEAATLDPTPPNYQVWFEITVPDTDSTSNGHIEIELYRERSIIR